MNVVVRDLVVRYGRRVALSRVSVRFSAGQSWVVCGPNGAGKSTLIKAIAGMVPTASGTIELEGVGAGDLAYLPQTSRIDTSQPLTVRELVAMGLWRRTGPFCGFDGKLLERIDAALERVGLSALSDRLTGQLSGGQLQRALFARALVQDAAFLLLDEPFNAVDEKTTADLLKIVDDLKSEGAGVVMVTHDMDLALGRFDMALLLDGEPVAMGTVEDVLRTFRNRRSGAGPDDDVLDAPGPGGVLPPTG